MKKKQESQEADGESMTITIENEASKKLPFDYKALIERVVMGCMDYEKCPYEAEVNVLLTNNEERQTAGRFYLGYRRVGIMDFLGRPSTGRCRL